jgi:HEAT repeat protein
VKRFEDAGQRELRVRQEVLKVFQGQAQAKLLKLMAGDSPEVLRSKLQAGDPVVRWVAVNVIAARRLPLEADVIELLNDPENSVRQAARQVLARLSRGTDFGPLPDWTPARRAQTVGRWKTWLALQQGAAPVAVALSGPAAGEDVPPSLPGLGPYGKIAPAPSDAALQTGGARASEWCDELVAATGDEQFQVLLRLKNGKGADYTEAIALAIPKLEGEAQENAREALAERLTRMTAKTLKAYLQDDDPELRAAAARACAMKEEKAVAPELITLLDDPDDRARGAAHAALRDLAGQDLGPKAGASPEERRAAADRWRAWWKGRPGP